MCKNHDGCLGIRKGTGEEESIFGIVMSKANWGAVIEVGGGGKAGGAFLHSS